MGFLLLLAVIYFHPGGLITLLPGEAFASVQNRLGVRGWDHLELVVGNARQAALFFQACLGFQPLARSGLETGCTDQSSYALAQGDVVIVLTSPLGPSSDLCKLHQLHGDGVHVAAMEVDDSRKAFEDAVAAGAEPFLPPCVLEDSHGKVTKSAIKVYGDTVHVFLERHGYRGPFLPGFEAWSPEFRPQPVGIKGIDHVVANVGWNEMEGWANFYNKVFGMDRLISFDDKDISTEFTALKSVVMTTGRGGIVLPINEPATGKKRSQIEEYLDFNKGPGVQHVALATDDIIATVSELRRRGVEFLTIPDSYYEQIEARVGKIAEDLHVLKELQILVDRDDDGYILQIFTRPLADRPTLFFEIIQRRGGQSFGKGNFKALFVSIEEEQRRRGTL